MYFHLLFIKIIYLILFIIIINQFYILNLFKLIILKSIFNIYYILLNLNNLKYNLILIQYHLNL